MKIRTTSRITLVFACLALVPACAAMGFKSSDKKLIKQASFDHSCPEDKIKVLRSMEGGVGQASFVLDVCGTERQYSRMGTGYYEKGKEPVQP